MNFTTLSDEKNRLRQKIRKQKSHYSEAELRQMSVPVLQRLEQLPAFVEAETLLLYWSLADEVFTHDLVEKWSCQKAVFLPAVVDGGQIVFRKYQGCNSLQQGAFRISEPIINDCFPASNTNVAILVPGMAFDREGNRLGRGKGFYDRFLRDFVGVKIGICFDFQLVNHVPAEAFDVKMDRIVF